MILDSEMAARLLFFMDTRRDSTLCSWREWHCPVKYHAREERIRCVEADGD